MRIVSFNINGIRARLAQLQVLRAQLDPDVLALQETKVQDADFPLEAVTALGYHVCYYGQKGHYGVALLSKRPPLQPPRFGLPGEPAASQRRVISAEFATLGGNKLAVVNGYYPQGENRHHPLKYPHKQRFYADMRAYLADNFPAEQPLLVVGDMNVAPADPDIGIGAVAAKRWLQREACGFLPEEQAWLQQLQTLGLEDTFRRHYPAVADRFSWFDYRSHGFELQPQRGLRVDLILANARAVSRDAGIDYVLRGLPKPSDHCPVWVDLAI